jgi:putative ABC transport system ATP-binding protein
MLELRNIQLSKRGLVLFGPLDYRFDGPGLTVISGPSGVGKSCLLRLLAGLERPDSGDVLYKDNLVDPKDMSAHRRKVVYVSQDPVLYGDDVLSALNLPRELRNLDRLDQGRLEYWLEILGLDYLRSDSVLNGLSGGEKRRLALIRAFLCEPDVLLLDEPTTGLDKVSTARIVSLFNNGVGQVFDGKLISASHDEEWIEVCATRLVLNKGVGLE